MTIPTLGLTVQQAAEATGLSVPWLNQLRCENRGPAYLRVGRRILYRPEDIKAWLDAHLRLPKAA